MSGLFLLHCRPDPRRLAVWGARYRLLQAGGDPGYLLHALLTAVFAENAPRTFTYRDNDQGLLAYLKLTPDQIAMRVALADANVVETLGLGVTPDNPGYNIRPFPCTWGAGTKLRFQVQLRPVVREGKSGREVDAFVHEASKSPGQPLDRAQVYLNWLEKHLNPDDGRPAQDWHGALKLLKAEMSEFQLVEVFRRTQEIGEGGVRQGRRVPGPVVAFNGILQVEQPDAFRALLYRGIGRHRSFGFGMLLLRPIG